MPTKEIVVNQLVEYGFAGQAGFGRKPGWYALPGIYCLDRKLVRQTGRKPRKVRDSCPR